MKEIFRGNASCVSVLVLAAVVLIFGSTITFWLGYFGGWLLSCFAGEMVTDGLNMVLGEFTQYSFKQDDIPLFCGIMTTIGGFFKSTHTTKE